MKLNNQYAGLGKRHQAGRTAELTLKAMSAI